MKKILFILIFCLIIGNVFSQDSTEIRIFNDFLAQIEYVDCGIMYTCHRDLFNKMIADSNFRTLKNLDKTDSLFINKKRNKKYHLVIYDSLNPVKSEMIKRIERSINDSTIITRSCFKELLPLSEKESVKIKKSYLKKNESSITFKLEGRTGHPGLFFSRICYNSNYALLFAKIRASGNLYFLKKREDNRWIIIMIDEWYLF